MIDTVVLSADLTELVKQAQRAAAERAAADVRLANCLVVLAHAAHRCRAQRGSGVEACARALGIARSTLQQYATIALRWSSSDLERLLARDAAGGHALSISHLLVLAPHPRQTCERLIARVRAEGLDVHALRALLRRHAGSSHRTGVWRQND